MHSQITTIVTIFITTGVLNLYLSLHVLIKRHHYTKIIYLFMVYTALIAVYCFSAGFGLLATSLVGVKVWTFFQYLGIAVTPPLGLLLVLQYLGYSVTKKVFVALLTIPSVTLFMVATNDLHHLHYKIFEFDAVLGKPYIYQEIGLWYSVHGAFIFASMLVAFFLLLFRWRETDKVYRPQLFALMGSQLLPMTMAFIYSLGLTPRGFDPVPAVLVISSSLFLWAIRSSSLFRNMPVAKDRIFNSINDGVVVLDNQHRLIEYNQACIQMFPELKKSMLGMRYQDIWDILISIPMPYTLDAVGTSQEVWLPETGRTYQVRLSALQQPNYQNGLVIIFNDITELKDLQLKLEHLAYFDELTQIYNRRAFFDKCMQLYAEAKEQNTPFTVMLMDIDFFKKVNDTYGHAVGDQVLAHVAQVCKSQLTDKELFARYGGEEFILALPNYSVVEAEKLANQIRQAVENTPLTVENTVVVTTISGGLAEATTDLEVTLSQLLNAADKALYKAKSKGRNCVYREQGIENEQ
ncbi:histidine kinase N-terminal 7TM domain-containing diguanylate cyclase [Bacillus ndiopicus]|uniref:histidine kinase N-terminal 7TM domain-containing diguanylate cyclase n=1 Tax=Bacillus ndiopicus TaxID=1347368 RepID=UPI0005A6A548|nr:diguanylate cyclase [Bacillus ndiopicus]